MNVSTVPFQGKVVWLTGASSGVGEAFARVELLIVGREKKGSPTVDACEVLVRVLLHHEIYRSPGFNPLGRDG